MSQVAELGPIEQAPTDAPADGNEPLIQKIRAGLGRANSRRVRPQHATVLATLLELKDPAIEVSALYKTLHDCGRDVGMAQLYRALRLLEEAGAVQRKWLIHGGRPSSVYIAAERLNELPADREEICSSCGLPHARSPSRESPGGPKTSRN